MVVGISLSRVDASQPTRARCINALASAHHTQPSRKASRLAIERMSVLLETSLGDIVIDLEVEACPKTCENFLKLCKVYYYNLHAFFNGRSHQYL